MAAQALDEEYYPDTPTGSKGPIETIIIRHGPSAAHPRAHELLALVLTLSVNSRLGAPDCSISLLGFRRLPTWRIMATRHPRRPLTRSAREFGVYRG